MRSIGNLIIGVAETHLRLRPPRKQRHQKWSDGATGLISLFPYRLTRTRLHKVSHIKTGVSYTVLLSQCATIKSVSCLHLVISISLTGIFFRLHWSIAASLAYCWSICAMLDWRRFYSIWRFWRAILFQITHGIGRAWFSGWLICCRHCCSDENACFYSNLINEMVNWTRCLYLELMKRLRDLLVRFLCSCRFVRNITWWLAPNWWFIHCSGLSLGWRRLIDVVSPNAFFKLVGWYI